MALLEEHSLSDTLDSVTTNEQDNFLVELDRACLDSEPFPLERLRQNSDHFPPELFEKYLTLERDLTDAEKQKLRSEVSTYLTDLEDIDD